MAVEHAQHRLTHRSQWMRHRAAVRPVGEVRHGRRERGPHRVHVPLRACGGERADYPGFGHPRRALARLEREGLAGQRLGLAGLPAKHPVPAQGQHEPQGAVAILPRYRPAKRRVQVVQLGGQFGQPAALPGPAQLGIGGLGQVQVVRGERVPHRGILTRARQLLEAVRTDSLQDPVPRGEAVLALGHAQDRLVDQAGQRRQHRALRQQGVGADALGRRQRDTTGKDGQPARQYLLGRR